MKSRRENLFHDFQKPRSQKDEAPSEDLGIKKIKVFFQGVGKDPVRKMSLKILQRSFVEISWKMEDHPIADRVNTWRIF